MVLGEYDPIVEKFELVCAGHVPPALIRGGKVQLLEEGSLPVGLVRGAQYSSFTVDAEPGDRLLVISDGVSEAEGAGEEMFGALRAAEALAAEADLERGAARVVEAALEFAGGEQADDATVVVLEIANPRQGSL
jgi:sigma-B regulation protein RsbU (phosphoserine phosphatase)